MHRLVLPDPQQDEATPSSGVVRVVLDDLPLRSTVDHIHDGQGVVDGLVIGVLGHVDAPVGDGLADLVKRPALQAPRLLEFKRNQGSGKNTDGPDLADRVRGIAAATLARRTS